MSESEQGGAGRREVAYRVFAAEYDDADYSYSESDEERAPNYVITPTGARVNRLFVVGVLTEVNAVNDDMVRARVVDPTGGFVLYAGQYQPDELAFLESAEPPTFVALTGKARTFEPDDADEVYSSIRPESINEVDAETRDRWTVQAAEQTLARVGTMASAMTTGLVGDELAENLRGQGVDEGLATGIPLALDHYDTTARYLEAVRAMATDAARVVAGERDEVDPLAVSPDAPGDETAAQVTERVGDINRSPEIEAIESGPSAATADTESTSGAETPETPEEEGTTTTGTPEEGSAGVSDSEGVAASETGTEDEPATVDASPDDSETAGSDAEPAVGTETTTTPDETSASETAEPVTENASPETDTDNELGDFEPGEFDLDEETREQVEEEFGTEFQSGTEVEEPGEADIETPDPEELEEDVETEAGRSAEDTTVPEADTEETPDVATGGDEQESDEPEDAQAGDEEPEDVEAALLDVMGEFDDGEGADRDTVVSTMADRFALSEDEIEDAIEDALMGGKCYEPNDTSLKPI